MAKASLKILSLVGAGSGIAGATTAGIMLLPSTVAQTLRKEGYILISDTERTIKDDLFNTKWSKYKSEATDNNLFPHSKEKQNLTLDEFKELCSKYENSKDTAFQDRLIKWCVLNIEDHVTKIGKKAYNSQAHSHDSWTTKFNENETNIKALITDIATDKSNVAEKLHNWCNSKKSEPFSNKNKSLSDNSLIWCTT